MGYRHRPSSRLRTILRVVSRRPTICVLRAGASGEQEAAGPPAHDGALLVPGPRLAAAVGVGDAC